MSSFTSILLVIIQSGLYEYGIEGLVSVKGGEFLNQMKE
jgi:hypothetical protein